MKSKILQSLHRDHANQIQLLNLIAREIDKLPSDRPAPSYELITLALEYCADSPSRYHHPREDFLYAKLAERAPAIAGRTVVLTDDHATLNALTQEFAVALADAIAGNEPDNLRSVAGKFLAHYRRHINIEESEIFPIASEVLTDEDWIEIENALEEMADPLFSEHTRRSYLALQRRIIEYANAQKRKAAMDRSHSAGYTAA